jgi:SAM-dependent methyltransferase
MDQSGYLIGVFNKHVSHSGIGKTLSGKTILEIGPGDSVGTALVAASYGMQTILVDAGSYAVSDVEFYKKLAGELSSLGLRVPDIKGVKTLNDILIACDAKYMTNGISELSKIQSDSVDLIFSQAVLEHIPKHEFVEMVSECKRILSPGGVASHRVDLKDHLGGSLNNLRFSEKLWESDFFSKSGFYTNRIRYSQMLDIFRNEGFSVEVKHIDRWDKLPISRDKLSNEFMYLSDDDLMINGFNVLLRANI